MFIKLIIDRELKHFAAILALRCMEHCHGNFVTSHVKLETLNFCAKILIGKCLSYGEATEHRSKKWHN